MEKLLNQEFMGQIIDIFDDYLEAKGINIPNPEKTDSENPAVFYGSDYGEVQSQLEGLMNAWAKGNVICPFVDERGNKLKEELHVNTEAGEVIARTNTDSGAPGLNVSFRPGNDWEEYDMVYIENKVNPDYRVKDENGKEVLMYVYGSTSDEYTEKIRYNADGTVIRIE